HRFSFRVARYGFVQPPVGSRPTRKDCPSGPAPTKAPSLAMAAGKMVAKTLFYRPIAAWNTGTRPTPPRLANGPRDVTRAPRLHSAAHGFPGTRTPGFQHHKSGRTMPWGSGRCNWGNNYRKGLSVSPNRQPATRQIHRPGKIAPQKATDYHARN